jgi:predicted TIM-barrel fold metal-dependent hydrolase
MRPHTIAIALLLLCAFPAMVCAQATEAGVATPSSQSSIDPALSAFIAKIRAVDNHTHVNTIAPNDWEYDALPLEPLIPFPLPVRLRPENAGWLAADRALYGYSHADLNEPHVIELRRTREQLARERGASFPEWVLDQIGTEVMLANRVAMGPGLAPPRFRWVSYVDALMLPLSTKAEAAGSPDRAKLYPLEEKLLRRYLADLKVTKLPATLDGYLRTVVTPTLERQRKAGCVAVKFEAGYLRSLDFDDVTAETASRVYSRYVNGGEPPHPGYKALEDFLFHGIAREAGRLGMAVHIHSLEGAGSFYRAAGSDPLLLESVFNDATLRSTNFVIVHGGGVYASHAGAMLWKPNVYLDFSVMDLIDSPTKLARVLEDWLLQFPEKVLFGTDASAFGPDIGWEVAAWVGTTTARQALGIALTDMMRNGDVNRARAEEIATMVLRTNAGKLYTLRLR